MMEGCSMGKFQQPASFFESDFISFSLEISHFQQGDSKFLDDKQGNTMGL